MAPMDGSVQSINRSSSKKNVSVDAHDTESVDSDISDSITTQTTRKSVHAFFF
jgi:hypothetical protein